MNRWKYIGADFDIFNGFGFAFAIDDALFDEVHLINLGFICTFFKVTLMFARDR